MSRSNHRILRPRAASPVNVPFAQPHGKIVVLVSSCSSICMEARTGAVDFRAEQQLEQQGHGSRSSGWANMDYVQLRRVLVFRHCERRHVGTCIVNAHDRFILV